jgi:hypothetical protein
MSDSPSITGQLCEFIRKHEPVRSPALREAFPDVKNPAALLAGPVNSGYLVACEVSDFGANKRMSKLLEYRLSASAGRQSYEDFKARGLPPPAASVAPLKYQTLRGRASTEALEQPLRKAPEGPVKKGAPPLAPWPGKKERAVFVDGNERFVSSAPTPSAGERRAKPQDVAGPGCVIDINPSGIVTITAYRKSTELSEADSATVMTQLTITLTKLLTNRPHTAIARSTHA